MLYKKLLERIEKFVLPNNPRNKKKQKKELKLLFKSVYYYEHTDPVTKLVSIKAKGFTYDNPERVIAKADRAARKLINKQKVKERKGKK